MKTDLDALLTALYVHLDDHVLPRRGRGRGRPPKVTDAELICLAVAQVLLRYNDERHWLRAAAKEVGHLFPHLICQSEYNRRLRALSEAMFTTARWLARAAPSWHERLRLMDGTHVPCGASRVTTERSHLGEYAGYGRDASHHRFYWGTKLLLITTPEGLVCSFGLANPGELDERKQAVFLVHHQPPGPTSQGCPIVCDKGFAGAGIEAAMTQLGHPLIRPPLKTETTPRVFPGWLRQRIEAIIWTLKNQLGLERHNARQPDGLWTRVCQRILALNTAIWHNWNTNAPTKRSLIAYDH